MGVFEQCLEFLSIFIGTDDPCSTVGVCVRVCVLVCAGEDTNLTVENFG